jgi:hypothetical protein
MPHADYDDPYEQNTGDPNGTDRVIERLADVVLSRLQGQGHDVRPPDPPSPPSAPPSPVRAEERETVLLEHLAECRQGVAECFAASRGPGTLYSARFEALAIAGRLMSMSLRLAAALDHTDKTFTHRIVVERRHSGEASGAEPVDVTPDAVGHPPPPMKKSKTIHGGRKPGVRNIG